MRWFTREEADTSTEQTEYAGQQDGVNESGVPYIAGQNVTNAVQDIDALLASMGFSSVEEMIAAANQL